MPVWMRPENDHEPKFWSDKIEWAFDVYCSVNASSKALRGTEFVLRQRVYIMYTVSMPNTKSSNCKRRSFI